VPEATGSPAVALAADVVSALDRAAHRRTDASWLAQAWPRARILVVRNGRAPVHLGRLRLVGAAQAPEGERLFLGVDAQDTPYFAVLAEESTGRQVHRGQWPVDRGP